MTRDIRRLAPGLVTALVIAVHAGAIASSWGRAYVGEDAPGYFVQARMIAEARAAVLAPDSPAQYVGVHWVSGDDGHFYNRYPPGFPLLIAGIYRIGGPTVALAINPVLASVSLLLFALIARRWTSPWTAAVGTGLLATLASFDEQALVGFSHMTELTLLLGGLWCLVRWKERPTVWTGLAAGFLIGALPAIRYPAALPGLALGVAALVMAARSRPHAASVWSVVLGAAVPLTGLLLFQYHLFGWPIRTGYSLTQEQSAFGWRYLWANLPRYGFRLIRDAAPIVLLGSVGMLALMFRAPTRWRAVLLAALAAPITVLYMAFFSPFPDSRLLLVTLPAYLLAALAFADGLRPERRWRVLGALVTLHLVWFAGDGLPRIARLKRAADRAELVREQVQDAIPPGAVIVAPLGFETLLEYEGRWKLVDWSLLWTREPPRLRPVTPGSMTPPTLPDFVRTRGSYPGLAEGQRMAAVLREAFDWAGDDEIYWIGDEAWIAEVSARSGLRLEATAIGRVPHEDPERVLARLGAVTSWSAPPLPVTIYRVRTEGGPPAAPTEPITRSDARSPT